MKNLEDKIQQLLINLIKEKDSKKRVDCLTEILTLNNLYSTISKKNFDDEIAKFATLKDFRRFDQENYRIFKAFMSNYEREIPHHKLISKNAILTLCDNFSYKELEEYETILTKDGMKEIILSFFEKYLNDFYPLVKCFYQDDNFHFLSDWSTRVSGTHIYLPFSKKSMIVCNDNGNLESMITIVHELGHMLSYYDLNKDYQNMEKDCYFEVFSYTLERIFINYLKEENFLIKECIKASKEEDNTFFETAVHLCFLTKLSSLKLNKSYEVQNWEDVFKKYSLDNIDKELYKDINLKDTLAYFYGYLLSLEYEQQFIENPELTIKYLRNLNCQNGVYPMQKLFSTTNLSIQEISTMKTLQKRLKN